MHHQNPVVPPESDVHPQNPVCTYSVIYAPQSFNEFMALLQANAVQGDCEKVYSNGDQCNGATVESFHCWPTLPPVANLTMEGNGSFTKSSVKLIEWCFS